VNFYKRHIGDYLKDTAHLSLLEHGVYTRLLDVYYTRESGIPDEQAARLIGARARDEVAALKVVLGEFFELIDGTWIQQRCEREIRDASTKAEASRENGKKGGRPKSKKQPPDNPSETHQDNDPKPTGNPTGSVSLTQKNLSQTPDSRLQTKTTGAVVDTGTSSGIASDDFRPKDAAEWLRHLSDRHGFEADPTNVNDRKKLWPVFAGWTNAGLTTAFVDAAIAVAIRDAKEPIVCLPLYVDRCMANANAARASPQPSWSDQNASTIAALTGRNRSHEPDDGTIDV
jgi:uncharacterized protein YdaU (DUF1376 family)